MTMQETYLQRVHRAVDDEDWQKFRLSLKGQPTRVKLDMLKYYYVKSEHTHEDVDVADTYECPVCIRIDNYIKALCRGGQLYAGHTLNTIITSGWNPLIKK